MDYILLHVMVPDGSSVDVGVRLNATTRDLEDQIRQKIDVSSAERIRLIYQGRVLVRDAKLLDYGVKHRDYVHCAISSAQLPESPQAEALPFQMPMPARGFDRLLEMGISEREVAMMRLQLLTTYVQQLTNDLQQVPTNGRNETRSHVPSDRDSLESPQLSQIRAFTRQHRRHGGQTNLHRTDSGSGSTSSGDGGDDTANGRASSGHRSGSDRGSNRGRGSSDFGSDAGFHPHDRPRRVRSRSSSNSSSGSSNSSNSSNSSSDRNSGGNVDLWSRRGRGGEYAESVEGSARNPQNGRRPEDEMLAGVQGESSGGRSRERTSARPLMRSVASARRDDGRDLSRRRDDSRDLSRRREAHESHAGAGVEDGRERLLRMEEDWMESINAARAEIENVQTESEVTHSPIHSVCRFFYGWLAGFCLNIFALVLFLEYDGSHVFYAGVIWGVLTNIVAAMGRPFFLAFIHLFLRIP